MGKKERIEALEERVTALEGEKPGPVFTETKNEPTPEPTLWWFDGGWWVRDRDSTTVSTGDVYVVKGERPQRREPMLGDGRTLFSPGVKILRPAKTFPAQLGYKRPELVESGKRRPVRDGDWIIGESVRAGKPTRVLDKHWAGETRSILIPISEARKRCGVEEGDISVEDLPADRQLEELIPQYEAQKARAEKAEARVKWLEDRCRRADDQWEERARVFQCRVMEAEARVKASARLVDVVRDLPDAPPGVRLPDGRREAIREALRSFGVGDGRAVRHEGVEG